jgi:SAM-dependent methyltransferase
VSRVTGVDYDLVGQGYTATRRADPRIAAVVLRALGDARSVLNVGAGAGAYEPQDRDVVAIEPSAVMIAQRPPRAAKVVQAGAEDLPFDDGSFDAVMAVLCDHHWRDRLRGFAELRRVARRRVVLFNFDPAQSGLFWLTTEYLPSFVELIPEHYRKPGVWERELHEAFDDLTLVPVPIPHDCLDGFYGAFWRRPTAYLDARVRSGISVFAKLAADDVARGIERLGADLASGQWHANHPALLDRSALHLGYYVAVAELATNSSARCAARGGQAVPEP